MARGQSGAAEKQLGTTNKVAGQYGTQANQLYGTLAPALTSEMNNPGYDAATKAAMTTAGMGAIGSSFGADAERAAERSARTRNPAGAGALQEALARNKGLAMGQEAAGLQKQFADYANQQRQQALAGLGNLYGMNTDVMSRLYGLGPSTLNARAAGKGGWGIDLGPLGSFGAQ